MKKIAIFFLFILLPNLVRAENIPDIVAVVNDKPITSGQLTQRKKLVLILNKGMDKSIKNFDRILSRNALNSLIDEAILFQYAKKVGMKIGEKEIESAIANFEAGNKHPKGYYEKLLKNEAVEYVSFMDEVKAELIKNEILGSIYRSSKVSPTEIDDVVLFTNSKDASVSALVFTSKDAEASTLLKMDSLSKKVKDCKKIKESLYKSFAEKEEINSKLSELDPQLNTILKDLRPNEPSVVFQVGKVFKFALLCDKKIDAVTPEENTYVTNVLANKKNSKKIIKLLKDLRSRAYIKIYWE